jgi:hypothetical protein
MSKQVIVFVVFWVVYIGSAIVAVSFAKVKPDADPYDRFLLNQSHEHLGRLWVGQCMTNALLAAIAAALIYP